jgi:hypothetical protein
MITKTFRCRLTNCRQSTSTVSDRCRTIGIDEATRRPDSERLRAHAGKTPLQGEGRRNRKGLVWIGRREHATHEPLIRSVIVAEGTLAGRSYGNLDVNGTASFAGILDLALSELTLAEGQTFDLFAFDSSTDGFSGLSVDGTSLVSAGEGLWTYDSLVLQEVWTPTSMSISVVPEPSTFALGAAGIAGAAWLRLRRRRAAAPQAGQAPGIGSPPAALGRAAGGRSPDGPTHSVMAAGDPAMAAAGAGAWACRDQPPVSRSVF